MTTARWTLKEGIGQARREMGVRERRDIDQAEIAKAVGVSTAAYSRWEKGERQPREPEVAKLAEYFGVTPEYLRYGVKPPPLAELLKSARKLTEEELDRADAIAARAEVRDKPPAKKARKRVNGEKRG